MKIKWNWGTKLTIWIIIFITFILTLVYMTTGYDINLVEEDYYPKGIKYQDRIDAINNAIELNANFIVVQTTENVIVNTPNIMVDSGSILFFRPSTDSLDMTYNLVINDDNKLVFPLNDFVYGKYILKINWKYKDKEYYTEKIFFVK